MSGTQETVERLTGMVKWFNNKAGFGFITVCDGEYSGKDI
jgi:cold shock CspA family protein